MYSLSDAEYRKAINQVERKREYNRQYYQQHTKSQKESEKVELQQLRVLAQQYQEELQRIKVENQQLLSIIHNAQQSQLEQQITYNIQNYKHI